MHERTDNEKAAIETMRNNMSIQDDPMVGIFWYDSKANELFGVNSSIASRVPWYKSTYWNKTIRTEDKLHEAVWKKEYHRKRDKRFWGDYTKVPRGRIFEFENEGFKVYTGMWLSEMPNADEIKEMIIDEFQLPKENIEFCQDVHWDLGRGWSNEIE